VENASPLSEGADYVDFVAAGALWLADYELETTLHTTTNGETWDSIDLTQHGLPAEAGMRAGTAGCTGGPAIDDRGDAFTVVYYTGTNGSDPQGLLDLMWLVDIAGDSVTVTPGASVGLEVMPAAEGDQTFRTSCAAAFVDLNGQRAMVGEGQWWKPFSTGNSNAFVAVEDANGSWHVHSTQASAFLGGVVANIAGVANAGGNLVAVLEGDYLNPSFTVWVSSDGRDWTQSTQVFALNDIPVEVHAVLATESGVAVLGATDEGTAGQGVLWTSTDGVTWDSMPLGGGDYFDAGGLVKVGDTYLVTVEYAVGESYEVHGWESADGAQWTPLEGTGALDSKLLRAHGLANGLVLMSGDALYVSGNPWR
jgi:hypothetical protein